MTDRREYFQQWYAANREELLARRRADYAANKGERRPYRKGMGWHLPEHREQLRARSRAYARKYRAVLTADEKARRRAVIQRWEVAHPKLNLAGQTVWPHRLPNDLQPIAALIAETRREIRDRRNAA